MMRVVQKEAAKKVETGYHHKRIDTMTFYSSTTGICVGEFYE